VNATPDVLAAIEAHARRTAPDECCGLLLGTSALVTDVFPTRNQSPEPRRRYEIAAEDHFAGLRHSRAEGVDVVGAYHSHPRSAAVPSDTDREQAFDNFVFVIVGLVNQEAEIRAWCLENGNFVEVPIVRSLGGGGLGP
jgi:proteasome lid subunit RPN8/RPN11